MKAFFVHIGYLVLLMIAAVLLQVYYEGLLPWLLGKRLAGATWLTLSSYETMIGLLICLILWVVGLVGMPWRMHKRFRATANLFIYGIAGLFVTTFTMVPTGLGALFFYNRGLWIIALPFRIVELIIAISLLLGLLVWVFGLIVTFLSSPENTDG